MQKQSRVITLLLLSLCLQDFLEGQTISSPSAQALVGCFPFRAHLSSTLLASILSRERAFGSR